VECSVREKKSIGGKAVDMRIGIGGLVAKVVQFMNWATTVWMEMTMPDKPA